eukprot:90018-Pelagomonas_calceolata.AAC.1
MSEHIQKFFFTKSHQLKLYHNRRSVRIGATNKTMDVETIALLEYRQPVQAKATNCCSPCLIGRHVLRRFAFKNRSQGHLLHLPFDRQRQGVSTNASPGDDSETCNAPTFAREESSERKVTTLEGRKEQPYACFASACSSSPCTNLVKDATHVLQHCSSI